jgi:hypothetical protein
MADPPRPPDENAPPGRGDNAAHQGDGMAEPSARNLDPGVAISPLAPASLTPLTAASQGRTMPEKSDFYPADNPAATKHIDVLQGIINRLANNSASCKTWCLTLAGALLSLAGATKVPELVFIVIVPLLVFRYLDSRYLAQEIAYRNKYNALIKRIQDGAYARGDVFDASAQSTKTDLKAALASWSVRPLYLTMILLFAAYVIAYLIAWKCGWLHPFSAPSAPPPPPALK